jgi:4-hydroxy-tetrahydrodipicolinate reductase
MNFLILGRGKTGSLVADIARARKHHVEVAGSTENAHMQALTPEKLAPVNVVIDFTCPEAALENMKACIVSGKNIVVGTTGWYDQLSDIRALVNEHGTGFLYGSNFSVGVNLFLQIAKAAAAAMRQGYSGQIFERHHVHKKDAPSGTALTLQTTIAEESGVDLEITSFREGEVVGMHEVVFDSANDNIYLCHDAKSRRGFADGAIRAAEWLAGKRGFYEFKDVWREL